MSILVIQKEYSKMCWHGKCEKRREKWLSQNDGGPKSGDGGKELEK